MKIHKEGYRTLAIVFISLLVINAGIFFLSEVPVWGSYTYPLVSSLIFFYFLQFFRNPSREFEHKLKAILAPADGSLVVVEETIEKEYYNDKRLQVSIFMSPFNVHSNRSPVSGKVKYVKYHPGKFLVAWHPKSSVLNERATVVIECDNGAEILLRQIAGAVARRIVTYPKVGDRIEQGEEIGFIKFGSRVDLFLPSSTNIDLPIGSKTRAGVSILTSDFELLQ